MKNLLPDIDLSNFGMDPNVLVLKAHDVCAVGPKCHRDVARSDPKLKSIFFLALALFIYYRNDLNLKSQVLIDFCWVSIKTFQNSAMLASFCMV